MLGAIALMGMLALAAIGATLMSERAPGLRNAGDDALPVLGEVPSFELTNQAGETVRAEQLRGRVWVADFIFTRCPSVCPMMTANMARLQHWLKQQSGGEAVRLVSFSVDPQHDRPEVLGKFAEQYEADLDQWHFLTGPDRRTLWRLSEDGFKLGVSKNPPEAPMPIAHSAKFVLVDRQGRIRGYYSGTRAEGLDELKRAIERLLEPSSAAAREPAARQAAVARPRQERS